MPDLSQLALHPGSLDALPERSTGRTTYLCRECMQAEADVPDGVCLACCLAALDRAAAVAATLYRPEGPGRILEPLGPEGLSW
jgi:hypothetical protein